MSKDSNVYPWADRKLFPNQTKYVRKLLHSKVVIVLAVLVSVPLFLSGLIGWGVAKLINLVFRRRPDDTTRLPIIVGVVGFLLFLVANIRRNFFGSWNDLLMAFGDEKKVDPSVPAINLIIMGFGAGLMFGAVFGWLMNVQHKYRAQTFLQYRPPTRAQLKRATTNSALISKGDTTAPGIAEFGVVVDDKCSWRLTRYGMIVERPVNRLGHGLIVGGTGSGKTVTSGSIVYYKLLAGEGVAYIDFKDNLDTRAMVTALAVKAGRKCHVWSMRARDIHTWMDLFDGLDASPSEKTAMLVGSLNFSDTDNSAYYTARTRTWLLIAFTALDAAGGVEPGEGTFDYLYRTCNTHDMYEYLDNKLQGTGDPSLDALRDKLHAQIGALGKKIDDDLGNLRTKLVGVINAAGDKLRPNPDVPRVDFEDALNGDLIYIGVSASADSDIMKTLGSLVLRQIGVRAGDRLNRGVTADDTRVLVLADEASTLEERGDAFDNLLKQGRAAEFDVWATQQSLVSFPETTRNELIANTSTKIVMRTTDGITAELLADSLPKVPHRSVKMGETTSQAMIGASAVTATGESMSTINFESLLSASDFINLESWHAYVWFTYANHNNPGKNTRDGAVMAKWSPGSPFTKERYEDVIYLDAPKIRVIRVDPPTDTEAREALHPRLAMSLADYTTTDGDRTLPEPATTGPTPSGFDGYPNEFADAMNGADTSTGVRVTGAEAEQLRARIAARNTTNATTTTVTTDTNTGTSTGDNDLPWMQVPDEFTSPPPPADPETVGFTMTYLGDPTDADEPVNEEQAPPDDGAAPNNNGGTGSHAYTGTPGEHTRTDTTPTGAASGKRPAMPVTPGGKSRSKGNIPQSLIANGAITRTRTTTNDDGGATTDERNDNLDRQGNPGQDTTTVTPTASDGASDTTGTPGEGGEWGERDREGSPPAAATPTFEPIQPTPEPEDLPVATPAPVTAPVVVEEDMEVYDTTMFTTAPAPVSAPTSPVQDELGAPAVAGDGDDDEFE